MERSCDVLITGTGSLAQETLGALAPVRDRLSVVVGGRRRESARSAALAASAQSLLAGGALSVTAATMDWTSAEALAEQIGQWRPRVVLHTASWQSPWELAGTPWGDVVKRAGYGTTVPLQAVLGLRLGEAIRLSGAGTVFVNACYPDVVNPVLHHAGVDVASGIGNAAILASLIAARYGIREPGRLQVLAHHRHLAVWNDRDADPARGPRVWLDGQPAPELASAAEVPIAYGSGLNRVTGHTAASLVLALLAGGPYRGHAPGVSGRPGGYPIRLERGKLLLDLPEGVTEAEAIAWNRTFEEDEGALVDDNGIVWFSDRAWQALTDVKADLPRSFAPGEIEDMAARMVRLRTTLDES